MTNNKEKMIGYPLIYRINRTNYIKTQMFKRRNNIFHEVTFNNNGKEIFVGRFKNHNNLGVLYKDGKVLIYGNEYNEQENKLNMISVIALYDILDDTFYSCTEKEALNLFDSSLPIDYLKNKDNQIYRTDIEKIKRMNFRF